jgi:hypothetical protein
MSAFLTKWASLKLGNPSEAKPGLSETCQVNSHNETKMATDSVSLPSAAEGKRSLNATEIPGPTALINGIDGARLCCASWAEWKAAALNRLFQEQGVTGQLGRVTAGTVRHGERVLGDAPCQKRGSAEKQR